MMEARDTDVCLDSRVTVSIRDQVLSDEEGWSAEPRHRAGDITSRMLAMVFIIADLIKWLLFQTDTAPAHCPSLLRALAKTLYFIAEANFSKKAINFPITAHNKIW